MSDLAPELRAVFAWIDDHVDEAIADLQRLVQQPSISAQGIGLDECADLVGAMMHADGLPATAHTIPGGPPCVIGHVPSATSSKTLLAYAHYDVQPPEPLEKWTYPAFGGVVDN